MRGVTKRPFLYWLRKPMILWTISLRRAEYLKNTNSIFYPIYGLWFKWYCAFLGITIVLNCCGPGLLIMHWGSVALDGKIGKNCRIHPGVTIGNHAGFAPTVGDNCYFGPGAKTYGNVVLGDNVIVGANAVVTKSFGSNCTLVGIPAKPTK